MVGTISTRKAVGRKELLGQLRFVDENCYATWFNNEIDLLPKGDRYALFSVRKFEEVQTIWGDGPNGDTIARPGHSLGSEDFVCSLIGRVVRARRDTLFDHPSLAEIRENRIHNFMLVDDGIGSGDQVAKFIRAMVKHRTFVSWWNLGLVKIHVTSFVRTLQSEAKIVCGVPGSDHPKRKFGKSSKIFFRSKTVYCVDTPNLRWGENHRAIYDLCANTVQVPRWSRLGYGNVMSNRIFLHSVPNNLPGMLWDCFHAGQFQAG